MPAKSPAVDAYIAAAAPFARPILKRIRTLFHRACPSLTESIKWGVPHFEHHGVLGGMAAFKQHVRLGFWRGRELPPLDPRLEVMGQSSMTACKVTSVAELPSDAVLLDLIQLAVALNEAGPAKKPARKQAVKRPPPTVPADLRAALKQHPTAKATFEAFSPSHQREYVEWITEAKQPATRERRIAATVKQVAAGKSRHGKYRAVP